MKDFQLLSGRTESEVKSKARGLAKYGWSPAQSSKRNAQGKVEYFEEGPVTWKEVDGNRRYYLGVVR